MAPEATLYAVKVLNQNGSGSDASIIAGLDWIADQTQAQALAPPIRVVNLSLGRDASSDPTLDQPLREAVAALYQTGITVVAAAVTSVSKQVAQLVPAGFPEVIAVASTTAKDGTNGCSRLSGPIKLDTASYFTTDGKDTDGLLPWIGVTVSAPGATQENVSRGCLLSSIGILSTKLGGSTTQMSGTSMAAPHVSGVVALMYQRGIHTAPEAIRTKLRTSAGAVGTAPLDSPTSSYSFDGEREGVLSAPGALN